MRGILFSLAAVCTLAITNAALADNIAQGVKVVVIDAGHGGPKFPGATYRGIHEKDLNLKVALKLGALIEKRMPDVKVVYTRKTDKQFSTDLNKDLQARAEIANKACGDIFISIHANAAPASGARGVETLIMGESPLETRANESVLFANNKEEFLDMSNQKTAAIVRAYIQNLQFTYGEYSEMMARLIQKNYAKSGRIARGIKRQPLKVLYATDMPSVLTEIGFMSNAEELRYMSSEKGQAQIAENLYNAVREYAEYVRKSLLVDGVASQQSETRPAVVADENPKTGDANTDAAVKAAPSDAKDGSASASRAASSAGGDSAAKNGAADANAPANGARNTGVQSADRPAGSQPARQTVTEDAGARRNTEEPKTRQASEPSVPPQSGKNDSGSFFTVQIMASMTPVSLGDARFGSFGGKVSRYTADGAYKYKYCIGKYSDRAAAQKAAAELRREFRDAFVVEVEGGRVVRRK